MPSATTSSSVKYNVKHGRSNRNNTSTSSNAADACVRYKRKLRAVLRKNRLLAQALEAAKTKIVELENASARQQKIDNLALPQIKSWLEMGVQQMRTAVNNHARAIGLLQDVMTPGLDITLIGITDPDDSDSQNRRRSLHPPGRQDSNECNFTVIPEEDESMDGSRGGFLDTTLVAPEEDLCSKITVRKKSRSTRSGHRQSLEEEPPSIFDEPQVPSFKVFDEQASHLLTEVTGQEKKVVCAAAVVLPPADKVKAPSAAHEYSAAFSYRPKIPRTPSDADKDSSSNSSGFFYAQEVSGSPLLSRQRLSDIPLLPWPRKAVGNARSTRRSSLPVAAAPNCDAAPPRDVQQSGSRVTRKSGRLMELRLSDADIGFMEPPATTAPPPNSDAASPEKKAALAAQKGSPNKAKVPHKKSCMKPQVPAGSSKAPRLTFVVTKAAEEAQQGGTGDTLPSTASTTAPFRADNGNPRLSKHTVPKKSHGKARSSGLEPPRQSGTLVNPEAMDISAGSSADEDSGPRTSSGRTSRRAAQAKSYKEPSLHAKLRRP